jgi:hypothetical protein
MSMYTHSFRISIIRKQKQMRVPRGEAYPSLTGHEWR